MEKMLLEVLTEIVKEFNRNRDLHGQAHITRQDIRNTLMND